MSNHFVYKNVSVHSKYINNTNARSMDLSFTWFIFLAVIIEAQWRAQI